MVLKQLNDCVQQFSDAIPPSLDAVKDKLIKELHEGLTLALEKLEVVTRQEFDIQTEVLKKTRLKLEKLEQKIIELEQQQS